MAAGRNGSYRDNEVRERKSDVEFTEKRDFYYSNGFDRERNFGQEQSKTREIERERERNSRERFGIRPKDIKERIVINNGYHSSSSTSNSDSKSGDLSSRRVGLSARLADREPGELSSGSGSDDTIASGSLMKGIEVISGFQNRVHSPPGKKRKFSPIVWDREKKTLPVTLSKDGTVSTDLPLPPPPPLPESFHQSLNTIPEGGMLISAIKPIRLPSPLPLIPKPLIGSGMAGPAASESPESLSTSPQDHHWSNAQEPGQLEEDDFVSSRNISSSRWAEDKSMSPGDDEMPRKRKKMTGSGFPETKLKTNASTPVLGELNREGLDRTRARSLGSDGGRDVGSGSEAEYPGNDSGKNDNMEIDEDKEIVCHSDTESDEKDDSQRTSEIKAPPQRCINMLQGCRSVDEYERLNKIDEGTYGVVYRAKDKKTGEIVALKKVKMEKEREGFPLTSLREINILLSFHHPSIVDVKEVVVGSNLDSIFMVMEYMEHDLKALMETMKQPFSQSEVKCLMLQLLEGVKYLHDNWVLHRDLKTSNLLLNNKGELKICDFGLSRQYGSPLKPYTHLVVTLWYRAPELLLGAKQYSTAIDMWSLGCIMGELLSKEPLFNGKTEIDQLDKIFRMLGTPSEAIWPGYSKLPGVKVNFVKQKYNMLRKKFPATSFTGSPILSESGFDLLNKLLTYDPEQRITAGDALNHEWFREVPLPKSKDFMPTFPAQHAQDRRQRRVMRSPDPLEEQRRKELQQRELGTTGLFG